MNFKVRKWLSYGTITVGVQALLHSPILNGGNSMRADTLDGVFTIFLEGEIDAQNAKDVQKELEELMEKHGNEVPVLDAKELTYISSAGLRSILTVQKGLGRKISVVNLSPEVKDIFEMAGFQYLMELKSI